MNALEKWDSFYVIVGSAGGALIGLQFVVLTLIAERPPRNVARMGPAFSTPTIVHFCVVLALSALLRVPWGNITGIAIMLGLIGAGGSVYMLIVFWRMCRQDVYGLDAEDWFFHVILPLVAYLALCCAAWLTRADLPLALFFAGGAALALLLDGIHNAWDATAFHVASRARQDAGKADE